MLAGVPRRLGVPNKASALTKEHNLNSIGHVSMKAKTLVRAVVREHLSSALKAQMCSPLARQTSGFRLVPLSGKVVRSNEVL